MICRVGSYFYRIPNAEFKLGGEQVSTISLEKALAWPKPSLPFVLEVMFLHYFYGSYHLNLGLKLVLTDGA